jgi:hydrogenase expression/formation protein HypC
MCLGVPGKIIAVKEKEMATADVNGNYVDISIIMTPQVQVGEFVMIHAGFAMQVMEQEEAEESLRLMLELQKIRESYANENREYFEEQQ